MNHGNPKEAFTVSNAAIYTYGRHVRHLPDTDLWTDSWGRTHSLAVLKAQLVFNRERKISWNRRHVSFKSKHNIWGEFDGIYRGKHGDLAKDLDPDSSTRGVYETGLPDYLTLLIPCVSPKFKRAELQAHLLVECARSQGKPCLDSPMPNASLGFFKVGI